jgi:hypothetical protein
MTDPIIRPLTFEDLDQALGLSTAVGWNQRLDDWRMLLQLAPAGAFAPSATRAIFPTSPSSAPRLASTTAPSRGLR